jgi:hypothetical protein
VAIDVAMMTSSPYQFRDGPILGLLFQWFTFLLELIQQYNSAHQNLPNLSPVITKHATT